MLSFRKPAPQTIQRLLDGQRSTAFSYSAVGATANSPPAGFDVDHTRVKLGSGEQVFQAAGSALKRWEQFRLGWVEAYPAETPIEPGAVVAVVARAVGAWWINTCRIIYVVDETAPVRRFGFAYGTLAEHVESGEERFSIEWNQAEDEVWYDIFAFSRPRHVLARIGYPLVRRFQRRFARESATAMQRAVDASAEDA